MSSLFAPLVTKVCLATGARWGEAEGLRSSQVKDGRIDLTRTKSGRNRSVPIPEDLERELCAQPVTADGKLFRSCYAAFLKAIERAGIDLPKGQAAHVLRHTFASHFIMNGGNILTLQRILGHSSLQMTMRYAHLAPEHLEETRTLNPLVRA